MSHTVPPPPAMPRHARFVRVTHWLNTIAFFALLVSGIEVVLSHPRFYWGEVGNVNTSTLFTIPVPSSRGTVPTSYGFILPDQNGWSRYLHFQSAWLLLLTGLVYLIIGLRNRHIQRNLVPAAADRSWRAFRTTILEHVRLDAAALGDSSSYNALQRVSYLVIVFVLVPLVVWTGLAMAPAFTAVFPWAVNVLGGRQSARTLHFFITVALVLFTVVHVVMIMLAGFGSRVRAMIAGPTESVR